jgi:hypothetical protein
MMLMLLAVDIGHHGMMRMISQGQTLRVLGMLIVGRGYGKDYRCGQQTALVCEARIKGA